MIAHAQTTCSAKRWFLASKYISTICKKNGNKEERSPNKNANKIFFTAKKQTVISRMILKDFLIFDGKKNGFI